MPWQDKIPEIVIGAVIVGGGGWLINQTYGMNRGLGSLEAKVDAKFSEHAGRIDRIAVALPDVGVRIARDELSKPITTAVLVGDPVKTAKGRWVTGIQVLDTGAKTHSTYLVPAKGPKDKEAMWLANGAIYEVDPSALSLKVLSKYSSTVGAPVSPPAYLAPQYSYVLRTSSGDYKKALLEVLKSRSMTENTIAFPENISSFEKLSAELSAHPGKYTLEGKVQ